MRRSARLVPLGALLVASVVGAQDAQSGRGPCDGRLVSEIVIRTQGPSFGGIFARSGLMSALVSGVHVTTSPDVVRRFLLLEKDKPCTSTLRSDSERILRGQPFLAGASVTTLDDGNGGVRVEVVTVDEISLVASGAVSQKSPYVSGLRLGSSNIQGLGIYAAGAWRDGGFYRDAWRATATDYQLFGRPIQLELEGERRRLGGGWSSELRHPFLTDVQRIAWRAAVGASRDYFPFARSDVARPSVPLTRKYGDVGVVLRVGEPGRLSLFGASLSHEVSNPSADIVIVTDSGLVPAHGTVLTGRYTPRRAARLNFLWGVRNIRFKRIDGFDALTGEQDVRTGFQLGTLFGRSLSVLGTHDDDILVSTDMYAGIGTARSFAAIQLLGEGRQSYDDNRWDDILASGRAAWYFKPHPRHTTIVSGEWGGGWRQRAPFQLTLGEPRGGMRGYSHAEMPGGQRAITRLEERWILGNVRGNADAGVGLLAEAGRVWAGDVPFGETTPVKYAVGTSVLAALPPGSKRLWRLDLMMPLDRGDGARLELRIRTEDRTRTFWREPRDIERSRERSLPQRIFQWP
ncbi:MAG TPA: hypothetical protein VM076_21280 [Gemmatimonadaceae bacterium]|nr:hypothetical protein [Gemmatimonadaceae bacterium]